MVSTPLNNISQIGSSSQVVVKIKHVPNHQPVMLWHKHLHEKWRSSSTNSQKRRIIILINTSTWSFLFDRACGLCDMYDTPLKTNRFQLKPSLCLTNYTPNFGTWRIKKHIPATSFPQEKKQPPNPGTPMVPQGSSMLKNPRLKTSATSMELLLPFSRTKGGTSRSPRRRNGISSKLRRLSRCWGFRGWMMIMELMDPYGLCFLV